MTLRELLEELERRAVPIYADPGRGGGATGKRYDDLLPEIRRWRGMAADIEAQASAIADREARLDALVSRDTTKEKN